MRFPGIVFQAVALSFGTLFALLLRQDQPLESRARALAGRLLRVPRIVFTAHGWASEESRPLKERALFLTLHWLTVLLSHCTIAVSKHTRRHLKWFPFASRKMITVHNGISIGAKLSRAASWELLIKRISVLAAHYTSYRIVSIAELHPNKGLDVALEGLAALGSVPWVWVIMGEGELRQELERRIQECGLHGRVILAGRVPRAAQYLPAFDLFLLPSRKEGLPYVLLEAGAVELPVLATSVGGIPELKKAVADKFRNFKIYRCFFSGNCHLDNSEPTSPFWENPAK